jgi:hypothetical protein
MAFAEHQLQAEEGRGSPDPLGWTLAMRLCTGLIALSLLAFVFFVFLEARLPEFF